ncbi:MULTISPECIES: diaminopimelate decarboxylase [Carboxydocella]|uniref:Diaminopimelate decarboxylase n=2 Tax=Carboxydocella TaxID=178898 RepID=A0A1T4MSE0_9FIRM|nr:MULTISPECIES: diaminopimelate decarboxylase [Carboxydocella]AVX20354.1 diaminopimelate decarboxylase [Carboxydocella thermautotrophica]AVX30778.1 diaminopimelate decarboxylase [Carboxydocella thermautotrophica]SJZ69756.1 diaminopimelate decarboxylase [Carboxydocella sporoproducens DSM 16521]GAW30075.1 diaminopimelate decarboxylase [Carboxydocella sp. ULO1]GAW31184.1 diaminopimelate decarboxylase [Carboxydocella sp. JDF658]
MRLHGTMSINAEGRLTIGGCDTAGLVAEFGTPLYVFDEELIRQNCRAYRAAFMQDERIQGEVIYASKAFMTKAMARIIQEEGLGLDVVSGGELYTALEAGFDPARIYFHGNNKSPAELEMALAAGIGYFVVDNFTELHLLNGLAGERGVKASILLRITPGVEAHTHEYIQTGQIDSKFGSAISTGQALAIVEEALQLPHIDLKGLHCHIGSQIFELESYRYTVQVMLDFLAELRSRLGFTAEILNLGGGFGIYYAEGDEPASIAAYGQLVRESVLAGCEERDLPLPRLVVEPGRSIIGPAGTTLYTVGSVKEIPGVRTYIAVDGGMGDNPRPALYQSRYSALLANKADQPAEIVVSVAGKYCESGDMLIWDLAVPRTEPGDILAVFCTGAYNYSMAMNYNRVPRPAAVLVKDGQADLIIRRESYADLVQNDVIPERLKK